MGKGGGESCRDCQSSNCTISQLFGTCQKSEVEHEAPLEIVNNNAVEDNRQDRTMHKTHTVLKT